MKNEPVKPAKDSERGEIAKDRSRVEHGLERDAPLAPEQNRTPGEEHRGGPLPNQKK